MSKLNSLIIKGQNAVERKIEDMVTEKKAGSSEVIVAAGLLVLGVACLVIFSTGIQNTVKPAIEAAFTKVSNLFTGA